MGFRFTTPLHRGGWRLGVLHGMTELVWYGLGWARAGGSTQALDGCPWDHPGVVCGSTYTSC